MNARTARALGLLGCVLAYGGDPAVVVEAGQLRQTARPGTREPVVALEDAFRHPPMSTRPSCYWWWLNNLVDKEGITHDLEEFKAKGLGGVMLVCSGNWSAAAPRQRGPSLLSPEWRELYQHTLKEAARLGLEVSVNYYGNSPLYFAGDYSAELVWESVTPIVADWFHNFYADRRIVEDNFTSADKWMLLMNRHLKPDSTIDRNEHGDWCDASTMDKSGEMTDVDGNRRRYEFGATSGPLIATAYHYNNCRIMARLAGTLGKVSEQKKYEELAAKVKTGFNARFFDPKTCKYWSDTQCAYVLSLAFGLTPEENRERVIANLVENIMVKHKGHLSVGLIGMQWLMQSLTDMGHPEDAYTIATQTTRPSWGYMISKGATTVWEKWDMDTQGPDMNSEALLILTGNLEAWFYQALAGINCDPAQPGFKHIIIKPLLLGDLTWVEASHNSMHGLIASHWRKRGDQFTLEVTIPPNTSATIFVPSKDAVAVTESGKPAAKADGVKFLRTENNAAVYAVGSGTYRFKSTLPQTTQ